MIYLNNKSVTMNISNTLYGIFNSFDKNSEMDDYTFYVSVNLVNIWPN